MAHHAKVSKGNPVGGRNLLGHDKRTPGDGVQRSNENIDPERTHLNRDYSARKMGPSEAWDFAVSYAQAHSAKKMRDNAVVMSCDVIHLPKNWSEATGGAPEAEFFERVALPFLRERYSWVDHRGQWPNEVSAVVHYDETKIDGHEGMPHLHYKYIPITSDGRTSHKEVNCRADLKTLHRDLVSFAESRGYQGLDLYDEVRAKARKSAMTMPEYKEAMKVVAEARAEAERALAETAELVDKRERIAAETAKEAARLESLRKSRGSAEERIEGLRASNERAEGALGAIADAREASERRVGVLEAAKERAEAGVQRLRRGIEAVRSAVARARAALFPPAPPRSPATARYRAQASERGRRHADETMTVARALADLGNGHPCHPEADLGFLSPDQRREMASLSANAKEKAKKKPKYDPSKPHDCFGRPIEQRQHRSSKGSTRPGPSPTAPKTRGRSR